ncbi:family 16 glycosylhydrolase [Chitinophaga sp. 2R12]|uniref:Family 16 glycosylhydrolase n=2 Tax=Chitinophagaceae TaxID=563835 RepID=A0ABS5IZ44_9BACT|nr:family 16 glycosylhydrolase [Chitinophaga hostae]
MRTIMPLLFTMIGPLLLSCQKDMTSFKKLSVQQLPQVHADVKASNDWEIVLDGNSFASYANFETHWNYLYPWGADHNGSARMSGTSTDHNNIYLDAGVLNIKAELFDWGGATVPNPDGPGTEIELHYKSGAIHTKDNIVVNDAYPNWEIKGDFQAPSDGGTWPAFWLCGSSTYPPECDILEYKGDNINWQNTYITDDDAESKLTEVLSPSEWHSYGIRMKKINNTDVSVEYYIDEELTATHTGKGYVGKPMQIIINLQMEGSSAGDPPAADTYFKARNISVRRAKKHDI